MLKKTILDMGRDSVEEFRRKEKIGLTMVLDNIRSLNNIGSIFRTSDAFRVERAAALRHHGHAPPRPKSTRQPSEPRTRWPGNTAPTRLRRWPG